MHVVIRLYRRHAYPDVFNVDQRYVVEGGHVPRCGIDLRDVHPVRPILVRCARVTGLQLGPGLPSGAPDDVARGPRLADGVQRFVGCCHPPCTYVRK